MRADISAAVILFIVIAVTMVAPSSANAQETTEYSYDALGRLVGVSHNGSTTGGVTSSYSYDPSGNRTNVTTSTPVAGGDCTFAVRDGGFSYDWEFPSNPFLIWIDKSGSCTAPTTIEYSFSRPGSPSGTFVVNPSQGSYYYYELPTPCASGAEGDFTTTIRMVSGPGSIARATAALRIWSCA